MVEIGHIVPTFHIIEELKMLAILDKRPLVAIVLQIMYG